MTVENRGEPKVAVDRAAISVSRDITFLQAARQLNLVVRQPSRHALCLLEASMVSLIGEWVGKDVKVTLLSNVIMPLHGKLLQADGAGLLLEQPTGHCFVPVTSILHVFLQDQNA